MYKKELKVLDNLFEYNGVTNIMPGRDYSQHLLWMNEYLADIDNLLADADLQTIDHHNFTDEIEYSNNFLIALLDYAKDLQCFVLSLLDTPFKDNLTDNAVDKINDIDINSYSTENTLDIKQRGFYNRGTKDFNYTSIGSVRFQDFIVGNAAYVVPDEFKGFTTQFSNYYENVKTNLNGLSEEEFLYGLLNKDTPEMELKKFVSAVLDITIIKPLIETFTGEDLITGKELSSMERGIKFAGAVVGIITLGSSGILKMPLDQAAQQLGRTLLIDVAATSASYATGIICEELDLPVGLTIILCIAAGTAVSITLNSIEYRKVDITAGETSTNLLKSENCIPNVEEAFINPDKLTKYALNPDHPVGANKARVFESALGYNLSNSDDLMKQVFEKLPMCDAVPGTVDVYGARYTVDIPITGPNGNTANVRTGWIIKAGSSIPELTTLYVK